MLASLAGCGGAGSKAAGPPPRTSQAAGLGALVAYLPIDAPEDDTLTAAARLIVNNCLKSRHLALSMAPIKPTNVSRYLQQYQTTEPSDWGSENVEEASRTGIWQRSKYQLQPEQEGPQPWTVASVPSQQQEVYAAIGETQGPNTPGCWKQVLKRIGDADDRDDEVMQSLIVKARSATETSEAGKAALVAWSRCLGADGYPNLVYAVKEPVFNLQQPPTPQELAYAKAEATCALHTHMDTILARIDAKFEQEYARQYSSQLWAAYREGQQRIAAARAVIASGE